MEIYNNVLHTYLHNPWKFHVIGARTFLVMQFVIQQRFAKPRPQHFGPDSCCVQLFKPAWATFFAKVCNAITPQPIKLESCSNYLRIQQVF